jgi:SAM-dependent methyltransferase
MTATREYYGIDAPTVVRNLFLGGILLLGFSMLPNDVAGASFAHALRPTGISLLFATAWMLASSLWIKKAVMRSLLGLRDWHGDEQVLDVGCGRGLVAIEAARRVPQGKVSAIDLWQAVDLSANAPAGIRANAVIAGVQERVAVDTGDARDLPYANASFDVVASMTAIHNISDRPGRAAAISEAWRVLRPGGQILIFDIRYARSYLKQLREAGAVNVRLKGPILLWGPLGWSFTATKPVAGSLQRAEP